MILLPLHGSCWEPCIASLSSYSGSSVTVHAEAALSPSSEHRGDPRESRDNTTEERDEMPDTQVVWLTQESYDGSRSSSIS